MCIRVIVWDRKRGSALYLLQMNVLVDDSLIPFWVHGLLGILGPSLVISTDNS